MLASKGILTSRGGRTSHAALVARQFGTPAVVGVIELEIDLEARTMQVGDFLIQEGDWISLDGASGEVFLDQLSTEIPDFSNPYLLKILEWADEIRTLQVWTNADYPVTPSGPVNTEPRGLACAEPSICFLSPIACPSSSG